MIPAPDGLPVRPSVQPADRPDRDCPDPACDEQFDSVQELIAHALDEHGFEAFSHLAE